MNGRTKIGEWAMGRFFNAARPLTEIDDGHISTIATSETGRLSYS